MRRSFDFVTLFLILAIGSLSLLIIFAINKQLYASQLIFWVIGLVIFYLASYLDYKSLKKIAPTFFVMSIAALLVLFKIGEPIRGSIRWIDLGPFRFQPSELTKVSIILLLATFFQNRSASTLKNVLVSFCIAAIPAFLVSKEPDLGNALSLLAIWFGMGLIAGLRAKHVLFITLTVLVVLFLGFEILSPYQKTRIESFLDPHADPLGTGYNVIQSQIAVGSGGIFGRGLGRGSQSQLNFLPEAESDFIFASLTEQLGLAGAILLIIALITLITRLANFANGQERFAKLVVGGICSYFTFQVLVNVGMNLGLLPVTGITLPLVSYGGSSLISTLFLLGIAFSIRRSAALN